MKIRRVQKELVPQKIINITGEDDPDKPTVITILPGKNPYDQIDVEEDAHEYMVGDKPSLRYTQTMRQQTTSQS